jgi:glycerol kinase
VWQDRRTADRCAELPADLVRERTGLVCDPYFSASKLEWILDHAEVPQERLAFGTVDSWIAWNLTGGAAHVTDVTNASRTMLLDLATATWDDELLELFSVDRAILPAVVPSSGIVAEATLLGATVPLAGIAGDQQSALFGQGCFAPGEMKATYGTGTFVLAHVGELEGPVAPGLLKTAVAVPAGGPAQYAAEGSVLVGGAAIQWLRDGLGLIAGAGETEQLAREAGSSGGVSFVPALTGLGAPQWDPEARGLISGITRGTTRAHLVRAALEAMAHQVADIVDVLPVAAGVLRADGGATANGFLMQLQADLIGVPVEVSADADATGLGAAALAGLAVGTWPDPGAITPLLRRGTRYEPLLGPADVERERESWQLAVRRATLRA